MKTEPKDVDTAALTRLLEREHGLTISALSFLPEGEDSLAYVAEDAHGVRHFARLEEDVGQRDRLAGAYLAVETLAREDVPALMAPRRTLQGRFLESQGRYLVALFPSIDGQTLFRTATAEDRARVADIVATLHESARTDLQLPRESLENPFEDPIRRAMSEAETSMSHANRYQRQISALLRAHHEDITSSFGRMEDFRREQDTLVGEWVLTHGEPHLANVLKDTEGRIHLTDCGDLAWGPPERDLFAFTGPNFEQYLRPYLRRRVGVRPRPRLFEYYSYRWALQEIADYATRILFRSLGPEEDHHAWREFQDYLPIRHDEIAEGFSEVRRVLARFSS